MSANVHCNHQFTCPAFLFANEVWSIVKREQERENGPESRPLAVSTVIFTKKESRGKTSRHSRTQDDLLSSMNSALATNSSTTSYVEAAAKFMQYDQQIMAISTGVDKLAIEKVNRYRETPIVVNGSLPNVDFFSSVFQNRSETVRHQWDRVQTLLSCIETHTRNAGEYHSFFTDCHELSMCMTTQGLHLIRMFDKANLKPPLKTSDVDVVMKVVSDMATSFKYYQQEICLLRNRAFTTVCPLQYRTKPVLQDCRLPARCLIDAEYDAVTLRKRQELFIIENTDQNAWKVRTIDGDVIEIPALFVEIPAPCDEALDCYGKLIVQLAEVWSDVVKSAADFIIWMTYVVFTNVSENEKKNLSATPQLVKSKLLQLILQIRSAFGEHWKDFDGIAKVEKVITDLSNQMQTTNSDAPAEKSTVLSAVDRLTSTVGAFDGFMSSWNRFATTAQICRAPESFLVADHIEFRNDPNKMGVFTANKVDDLVKGKWRQKLEAQNKAWKDSKAISKGIGHNETQTEIQTVNKQTEAKILAETADANVDCVNPSNSTDVQTDNGPNIEHQTQTEAVILKNQEVEVSTNVVEKMVDCSAATAVSNSQTDPVQIVKTAGWRLAESAEVIMTSEKIESVHVESTNSEEEQFFVIAGVVDIAADKIISLDEAIQRKIIDQAGGTFRNTENNELVPIPEAMNIGNIVMEMKSVTRKENRTSYGMIILFEKKEKKMLKIISVTNNKTGEKLSPKDAIKLGILGADKTWAFDVLSNTRVELDDAVRRKIVEVIQRPAADAATPSVKRRQFEVYEVLDKRTGQQLSFDDAVRRNVLNLETGEYLDTATNIKVKFSEAIRLNYVQAKLCEDAE